MESRGTRTVKQRLAFKATKITKKQKFFIAEYPKDFNGTQAAIRAGYSPKRAAETAYDLRHKTSVVIANKLVKKSWVLEAIKKEREERLHRVRVQADREIAWQLLHKTTHVMEALGN